MDANQIEAMKKYGKVWEKGHMSRIYFNYLSDWYGLKTENYNTGNVCSAWVNGEKVSNSEAKRIMGRLAYAKVWYDLTENKFFGKDIERDDFDVIVAEIKRHVTENTPHPAAIDIATV